MRKLVALLAALLIVYNINAQSTYFPPITGDGWETTSPESLNWCQDKIDSLYNFLHLNQTKAFVLLKDGKIVLEKYFGAHSQSTNAPWNSAGKTITSFMIGIAQQEMLLSIGDTSSNYLGQSWTDCTPEQEEKITIRHQLTMTSGLADDVPDPYCTLDTCLVYKANAGTRWAYHNAPYTLLDQVIAQATGFTLNEYTSQKLKNPTGINGLFIPVGYNNVFFSTARSMARFGHLMLNKGTWDGTPIMTDTSYFNQMVSTSQAMNEAYGYLWWLNGKSTFMLPGLQIVFNGFLCPDAPADIYMAMGKDGQFLNILPGQNMVWVRMGDAPDSTPVPYLLNNEIWKYINELECELGGNEIEINPGSVELYPNPVNDMLSIRSDNFIQKIEIFNIYGHSVKTNKVHDTEVNLPIKELDAGLFFVKVHLSNGKSWMGKFIKK